MRLASWALLALATTADAVRIRTSGRIRPGRTNNAGFAAAPVHVDVAVDPGHLMTVEDLLHQIAPSWVARAGGDFAVKPLCGGLTNCVLRAKPQDGRECESLLVRVFGEKTDHLINRELSLIHI